MILVITHSEKDRKTGETHRIVSHGIDLDDNDRFVTLPNVRLEFLANNVNLKYSTEAGEWYLE